MTEQLQWFFAVLLVVAGAVAMGAAVYAVIALCQGGVKRASRMRRCAMPKRIRKTN
jgi:hypothetical protein